MTDEPTYHVTYVGTGLSGRTTSLVNVLASAGHVVSAGAIRSSHQVTHAPAQFAFDLAVDGKKSHLMAAVSWVRAWLWYEGPHVANLDARIVAEFDVIAKSHGLIFVIDSHAMHKARNLEAFEKLREDLAERGCDIQTYAMVFQVNKRDVDESVLLDWVRQHFKTRRCAYTESVALKGIGPLDAMSQLVRLMRSPQ